MKPRFERIALIGKYQTTSAPGAAAMARAGLEEIARFLQSQGCEVVIESDTATHTGLRDFAALDIDQIPARCQLAVVVGGDGTMLGMGRRLAGRGLPLVGINQGRLGFITDIPISDFRAVLGPMLLGEFEEDERSLMQAQVQRAGSIVFEALAMNDVVVNRGATSGMVELRVEVDGKFVASQRADGLIVASPTGSTAYALSAGGPLLHPAIAGWVLVPIAAHTLSNRPIVISNASEIAIEVVAARDSSANFDMQSLASLQRGDRVVVRRSGQSVVFLHPRGWSYFDTLRKKLHWNEGGS